MQGQINPTGHLQGSINPTANLQGTMSTESLIGGQVVGMRGFKGDKGDKGDTGEQGERGYGITSIVYNADKTITITYADGETVTTAVLQGEKGDKGDKGDTGQKGDTGEKGDTGVKGDKGDKGDTGNTGATGNGIASAVLNPDYTLTLTFTDGTSYTTPSIRGNKGEDGYTPQKNVDYFDGEDGQDGQDGQDGFSPTATVTKVGKVTTITITDKDGTTTTTVRDGEDGHGSGDMLKATYDTDDSGVVDSAESVAWSGVTGKPSTFPPSEHTHAQYLTDADSDHKQYVRQDGEWVEVEIMSEVDWTDVKNKPSTFPPSSHNHTKSEITDFPTLSTVATSGSYNDLSNKPTIPTVPTNVSAFTNDVPYLTSHQSLSAYRTSAEQDIIDSGFVEEAPTDHKQYARQDGDWEEIGLQQEETADTNNYPVLASHNSSPSGTVFTTARYCGVYIYTNENDIRLDLDSTEELYTILDGLGWLDENGNLL